eukprot:COSAG02_NODE_4053_length_5848_cov_1.510002_7_plen_90_part_00
MKSPPQKFGVSLQESQLRLACLLAQYYLVKRAILVTTQAVKTYTRRLHRELTQASCSKQSDMSEKENTEAADIETLTCKTSDAAHPLGR